MRQKIKQILLKMKLGWVIALKNHILAYLNADTLKVPYPQTMRISAESSDENTAKKALVREILWTEYNENIDKTLHNYFLNNKHEAIHKWYGYFDVYEKHFSRLRGRDVNILEIGIQNGGSTKMWKHYFGVNGAKVNIYGVDIDPRCKKMEDENIKIFIGSQEDRGFWRSVKEQIPKVDILIDDGGHTMRQQIVTFEEMYPHIKHDGIYWCEDLHTSYWKAYGGGGQNAKLLS
ncbi:hypothetical protein [Helicobacter sp. 23-1045]